MLHHIPTDEFPDLSRTKRHLLRKLRDSEKLVWIGGRETHEPESFISFIAEWTSTPNFPRFIQKKISRSMTSTRPAGGTQNLLIGVSSE